MFLSFEPEQLLKHIFPCLIYHKISQAPFFSSGFSGEEEAEEGEDGEGNSV